MYTLKWIKIFGTQYTSQKCVLAIGVSNDMPVFGKLNNIFVTKDNTCLFLVHPYKTINYNMTMLVYDVLDVPTVPVLVEYTSLLDIAVYHTYVTDIGELYIPLKYDLRALVDLHSMGKNPHFLN